MTADNDGEAIARGDYDALVAAFEKASPMSASHWNVETGELFAVRHSRRQRKIVERFEERLFDEDGWLEIPFQESDEAYAMARHFVDELSPGKGRATLARALDADKPFRRFRDVLRKHKGLARRWQRLVNEEAQVRLVLTCVGQGLAIDDPRFAHIASEMESQWQADERQRGLVRADGLSLGQR